jgi:hypothetical protein
MTDFTPFKTGRLKATQSKAFKDFAVYTTGPFPSPPPTFAVPGQADIAKGKIVYPIDGNDKYGDCTIAGLDHLSRAQSILYKEPYTPPTEQVLTDKYFSLGNGQDNGLNEEFVLREWHTKGIFGTKIAGFAPVSITNLLLWHQAIAFYGGLYLGIACPESAQRAFQKEQETGQVVPWTYEGEQTNDGHCVVALGYGPNGGLHCATWGGIAVLTPSFLAHYLDEAWVVLSQQLVEAKKDTLGLNLEALQADLAKL